MLEAGPGWTALSARYPEAAGLRDTLLRQLSAEYLQ
jgi:hypothetical protein